MAEANDGKSKHVMSYCVNVCVCVSEHTQNSGGDVYY